MDNRFKLEQQKVNINLKPEFVWFNQMPRGGGNIA